MDRLLCDAFINQESRLYGAVHRVIVSAILYSVLTIMLETVQGFESRHATFFRVSGIVVLIVVGAEYITLEPTRIWET